MSTILVNIPQVNGSSTIQGHEDEIECNGIQHAISKQMVAKATRTEGASRHSPVQLTHNIDRATPKLKDLATQGTVLDSVVVEEMRMVGEEFQTIYKMELTNASVVRVEVDTPVDPTTNEPGMPIETFSLAYTRMDWTYTPYDGVTKQPSVTGSYPKA
ncbi:MAG: type VI secretion system tube protein Hcp [Gammaproteobacteria bacterium]|nr:type VI secretion system tube protein Hcp [Gammaproteobacteria bacterium]MYB38122.1 type VI secretion system tube protein Hcp [Gammaproteobacteria bacterium]